MSRVTRDSYFSSWLSSSHSATIAGMYNMHNIFQVPLPGISTIGNRRPTLVFNQSNIITSLRIICLHYIVHITSMHHGLYLHVLRSSLCRIRTFHQKDSNVHTQTGRGTLQCDAAVYPRDGIVTFTYNCIGLQ